MKGFKKISVLTNIYEMSKSSSLGVNDKVGEPVLTDRIFGLADANKRNADYKNKRRWIEIDWIKTAQLQLEAGNTDWLEYVLGEKELECKALKRLIKFPVKDSYNEALDDGEELEAYNDYISVVENQIDVIKGIEFKPKPIELDETNNDETIENLKAIIKDEGLGIRVSKEDTFGIVLAKIEEARK